MTGCGARRIALDAHQELRVDENAFEGGADARVEALIAPVFEERQERAEIGLRDRTPIGTTGQRRQNLRRAAPFGPGRAPVGAADEDALSARGVAGTGRVERAFDFDDADAGSPEADVADR